MATTHDTTDHGDHEYNPLTYADAVRDRVNGLYARADAPGTPAHIARDLAAKAHRLLATISR